MNGNVWPPYGVNCNGQCVDLHYVEFSKDAAKMGAIHGNEYIEYNEYNGNSLLNSNFINNCFNYWDQLFTQFDNF